MSDPLFSVADQIVLISGGSRGIGRAIAQGFADRHAKVVITGRDEQTIMKTAAEIGHDGQSVLPLVCDVANPREILQLVERVLDQYQHVDTLVNVAGVNRRKPALEITEKDYDFVMDINLKGAFLMSQAIAPSMLERRSGCQINITSLNEDRPLKHVGPYAMSKAGLGQMTRALAMEWGERGVRVNSLAPGFVITDLTEKLWSDQTMQSWGKTNTPQKRLAEPHDMVGTAIFLASQAAAYITGQTIYVDGGFTAGWAWPIPE